MSETVPTLVTTKPDAELTKELRQRLEKHFEPVLEVMNEAFRAGFVVGIALQINPHTGRYVVGVDFAKHY